MRRLRRAWRAFWTEPEVIPQGAYLLFVEDGFQVRFAASTLNVEMETSLAPIDMDAPLTEYRSLPTHHGSFNGTIIQ